MKSHLLRTVAAGLLGGLALAASASAGELVFTVSNAQGEKTDIAVGERTRESIALLKQASDACYQGDATETREILERMIANSKNDREPGLTDFYTVPSDAGRVVFFTIGSKTGQIGRCGL